VSRSDDFLEALASLDELVLDAVDELAPGAYVKGLVWDKHL